MQEGVIVKIPIGSEPLAIRQQWLYLRFVFDECDDGECSKDALTGAPLPMVGREYLVDVSEAFRIMENQRPGMAEFYRTNTKPELMDWPWSFREDEIHLALTYLKQNTNFGDE